mmetsp:Transcript_21361/g.45135  ORF Transcript_21361/g.45135 Transcript_21361/m.45135 type:complete len:259 (+) Transcript_21361:1188-1964(+)
MIVIMPRMMSQMRRASERRLVRRHDHVTRTHIARGVVVHGSLPRGPGGHRGRGRRQGSALKRRKGRHLVPVGHSHTTVRGLGHGGRGRGRGRGVLRPGGSSLGMIVPGDGRSVSRVVILSGGLAGGAAVAARAGSRAAAAASAAAASGRGPIVARSSGGGGVVVGGAGGDYGGVAGGACGASVVIGTGSRGTASASAAVVSALEVHACCRGGSLDIVVSAVVGGIPAARFRRLRAKVALLASALRRRLGVELVSLLRR